MKTPSFEQLLRVVAARFAEYQGRLTKARNETRLRLRSEYPIFMDWVFHETHTLEETLTRDSEEWLKIYREVSQEYGCPELLFPEHLTRVRGEIMGMIDLACVAIEDEIKRAADAAGFTAPLPGKDRYNVLRGRVLKSVVPRLEVLEAEGAVANQAPQVEGGDEAGGRGLGTLATTTTQGEEKAQEPAEPTTSTLTGEPIGRARRGRPRTTRNYHPEVEPFLDKVTAYAHKPITIMDFCSVSGFTDDTVFGAWRRGDKERCNSGQAMKFQNTLNLSPEDFLRHLGKGSSDR